VVCRLCLLFLQNIRDVNKKYNLSALNFFCPFRYESENKKITHILAYPRKQVASTICMLTNQGSDSIDIENGLTKIIKYRFPNIYTSKDSSKMGINESKLKDVSLQSQHRTCSRLDIFKSKKIYFLNFELIWIHSAKKVSWERWKRNSIALGSVSKIRKF